MSVLVGTQPTSPTVRVCGLNTYDMELSLTPPNTYNITHVLGSSSLVTIYYKVRIDKEAMAVVGRPTFKLNKFVNNQVDETVCFKVMASSNTTYTIFRAEHLYGGGVAIDHYTLVVDDRLSVAAGKYALSRDMVPDAQISGSWNQTQIALFTRAAINAVGVGMVIHGLVTDDHVPSGVGTEFIDPHAQLAPAAGSSAIAPVPASGQGPAADSRGGN